MDKKLLIYGFNRDELKYNTICETAKNYDIEVGEISYEDISQKVGTLMKFPGYEREDKKAVEAPEIEFLLFSDFDREPLMSFLKDLREAGLAVPYKSVVTETSKDWEFSYLLEHIQEEHLVMTKFNELGKLVKRAQDVLEKKESKNLRETLEYVIEIKNFSEINEEIIEERYNKLVEALKEEE
ncbi:protein of unknown function [Anaerosphaera aminiphila DSM 21120]|uniref:DUF3783 domain-containing protein n=1 Tax=Anaerosphaera aminiphila DSM 21120 TaxID=1120995 RepID=A0A1M5T7K0_9FIRM|nr:DUF3783 domain-containing protein [Anaerosphaera aminiphila]SHH46682.1 protein of unknown function [Anaerosphaera aminiphila DSM 21120]